MLRTSFFLAGACLLLGALLTRLLAQGSNEPTPLPPQNPAAARGADERLPQQWEYKVVLLKDLTNSDQEPQEEIAAIAPMVARRASEGTAGVIWQPPRHRSDDSPTRQRGNALPPSQRVL